MPHGTTPGSGPNVSASGCGGCGNPGHDGGLHAEFGLGSTVSGMTAGTLAISVQTPSPALATPASLNFIGDTNITTLVLVSNQLAQVYSPQTLVAIVTNDAFSYFLNFYYASQVGAPVNGLYPTNGLTPYVRWVFQNPNGTNSCNTLQLTETRGSSSWTYGYIFDTNMNSWTYVSPGGIKQEQLITTNNPDGTRTLTQIISQPNGQPAKIFARTYQEFPWGEGVVSETDGTGSTVKTTTMSYYANTYPANGSYIPLQQTVNPDGSWTYYQYAVMPDGALVPTDVYSGLNDQLPPSVTGGPSDSGTRHTHYNYAPLSALAAAGDDGSQEPDTAREITEYVNGQVVSQSYAVFSPGMKLDIRRTTPRINDSGSGYADAGNLVTTTKYFASGPNQFREQSVANPDGTLSLYNYAQAANGWQTNIVSTGQPNGAGTAIMDGTVSTTVMDSFGQTVLSTIHDVATGNVLSRDVYGNFDALDRAQQVTHFNGTSNLFNFACCYLESTVDSDGVMTYFLHDAGKRQYGYEKFFSGNSFITYQNTLDAMGRAVKSQRIGSDNSIVTLSQSSYDTAGRLIAQTNAANGVTTYLESTNALGALVRTTINPDGGQRIDTSYLDGSQKSSTGTATHGKAYGQGVEMCAALSYPAAYTAETNLDANGNPTGEWTKSYTDMAGRNVETLYADGHFSQSFHNSAGQLWKQVDPDGVTTLYVYNAKGEQAYAITALSAGTQSIASYTTLQSQLSTLLGGTDRVTATLNDVITDHGTTVRRSRSYVWAQNGSSTSNLVSLSETSADGLNSWQTSYADANTALTSHSQTVYSGSNRSSTSVAPDGSYTVSSYAYGRLLSTTRYDVNGKQLGGTTYAYDAHGRQYQVTDARNGTTTYAYNAADQVSSVTTPNPGNGQPETTTTLYDPMQRPNVVIQPDGTTVSSVYLLTGELGFQFGSRTYPVAYSFDYAGRQLTMTNWSGFDTLSGARVTTWNYDPQRGWLTSKLYPDGRGPTYHYTAAGRLQQRTWARGLTTTYAYDLAGGLSTVSYSDATPGVTYTYDRLGRQSTAVWNGMTDTLTYNLASQILGDTFTGGSLAGLSLTNTYDSLARRTALSFNLQPSTFNQSFGYDQASRLASVSDGNGNVASYTYLANSPLVSQISYQQNGTTRMTTRKTYDYLNRLTQVSSQPSASGLMPIAYNYSYNPANQRTRNVLADGSYWVYGYDALGQATNACKYFADGTPVPGQQFNYAFDTIGNRTQTRSGGDAVGSSLRLASYSANTLNQITQRDVSGTNDILGVALAANPVTVNGQTAGRKGEYFWSTAGTNNAAKPAWIGVTNISAGATNQGNLFIAQTPEIFLYDADGNLTNDGRWAYVWDAENRLIQMTVNTNVGPRYRLTFGYDYKSRRIQKTVATNNGTAYIGQSTNTFVYDGWNLIAILAPNSQLLSSYTWGSDLSGSPQGAGGVGGLLSTAQYANGQLQSANFYAYDGNGNVAALINAADGTVAANYEYAAFGEPIRMTGAMAKSNPFRFSTKYADDETDLLYYGYRYYKPSTGTWPNRDPLEEQGGMNLYGFCDENSISRFDVLGLLGDPAAESIISRGLKQAEMALSNSQLALAMGLPRAILSLERTVSITRFKKVSSVSNTTSAEFDPTTHTLEIAGMVGPDTAIHEMVHAYNDAFYGGGGVFSRGTSDRDDEGMAYCMQNMYSAASSLVTMEKYLKKGCPTKSQLTAWWVNFWNSYAKLGNDGSNGSTYTGWSVVIWDGGGKMHPMESTDINNTRTRFGAQLSCAKLALQINNYLQKNNCCQRVSCDDLMQGVNLIGPQNQIDTIFQ